MYYFYVPVRAHIFKFDIKSAHTCRYDTTFGLRNFIICTSHQIILGDQIKKNEMSAACSTYGETRGAYRSLMQKPEGIRRRRRCKDNFEMDLQEVGCVSWIELICLRIGTSGGLF
jgi:hypothetical protein